MPGVEMSGEAATVFLRFQDGGEVRSGRQLAFMRRAAK